MPACFEKPKDAVRVDATTPTLEMRRALEEDGIALPDEAALLALSEAFNERLRASREMSSTSTRTFQHGHASWMDAFNEIDVDHNGAITFDEFRRVVRAKLKFGQDELPPRQLKALWVALDVDDSDAIRVDEMMLFLKGSVSGLQRKRREALQRAAPVTLAPATDTAPSSEAPPGAGTSAQPPPPPVHTSHTPARDEYGFVSRRAAMRQLPDGKWEAVPTPPAAPVNWRRPPVPRRPAALASPRASSPRRSPRPSPGRGPSKLLSAAMDVLGGGGGGAARCGPTDATTANSTPWQAKYAARPITSDVQRRRDLANSLSGRGRPGQFPVGRSARASLSWPWEAASTADHAPHEEHAAASARTRARLVPQAVSDGGDGGDDDGGPSTEWLIESLRRTTHRADGVATRRALEYLASRSAPSTPASELAPPGEAVATAPVPAWRAAPHAVLDGTSSPRDLGDGPQRRGVVFVDQVEAESEHKADARGDGGDHAVAAMPAREEEALSPLAAVGASTTSAHEHDGKPSYGDQFSKACWRQEAMARRELDKERRIWRWAGTG
jgi:hypothetical protein